MLDVPFSQIQAPGNVWALSAAGWNVRTEAQLELECFVGAPVGVGVGGTGTGECKKQKSRKAGCKWRESRRERKICRLLQP